MRLRELHIQRLPGIAEGFVLDGLESGVNVIVGPNASGKSSVLRALRAALYPEEQRDAPLHVEAVFEDARGRLRATRLGRELTWQRHDHPVEPPPLPEYRFLSCYTLRIEDLLDADGATDQEIARRLARELAGGYDLAAVRDQPPFRLKQNHGRDERKALAEAQDLLSRKQREHRTLHEEERKLTALRAERDACAAAAGEAEAYGKALELLEARRRRTELEQRLAAFSPNTGRLRGDERTQLEHLRKMRREQEIERERAAHAREDALGELQQCALADSGIDAAALAEAQGRLQRLQRLEGQVEQRRGEWERAGGERRRAITDLGGEPERLPLLRPDTLHRVDESLTDKRRAEAKVRELDGALDRLPKPSAEAPDAAVLGRAREALLSWLAAPRDAGGRGLRAAVITALVLAVLGTATAAALLHWSVALLAVPLAVAAYPLLRPAPGSRERDDARRRFAECGLAEPRTWQTAAVTARLRELDEELRKAERRADDLVRREETERQRAAKEGEVERARTALAGIAAEVGFDPGSLDAAFDRWLRLVETFDRAHGAAERARQEMQESSREAEQVRAALAAFLDAQGDAPGSGHVDSDALGARLARLAERVRRRDAARSAMAVAQRDMDRAARDLQRTDEQIRALFSRVELEQGDDATLYRCLDQLDAWKKVDESLRVAQALEQEREQALRDIPEPAALAAADDHATLQARWDELTRKSGRSQSLSQEITRIETRIDEAQRRHELEEARAACQAAEDALRERLEEALFAAAGGVLLDQVREEHEQASEPPALRRAAGWFQRFTGHQYELQFTGDGDRRFAARETASGELRNLAELSSGTRMQLLLAVRIAFALESERGREALPLVLDEALTAADPERFGAAARSLATLAREDGRQVFYMTAQPGDLAYWRAHGIDAHCIDLAEVRRMGRAITDERQIALPPEPQTPSPGGRSPEAYAAALGVPPVDPWSPPAAVHVFYLLRDDLQLLHRLIKSGIHRAGPLRALLDTQAAESLLTEEERRKLRRRIAAVEPWFEAWRTGRGRPVDRAALAASEAVSGTFLNGVAELNERLGGAAGLLLDRLEKGAVKRFQAHKREELRAWLTDYGYLDERRPLSTAQIQHQVLAALGAFHDDRDAALAESQLLAASLEAGTAAASAAATHSSRFASAPAGR